MKLLLISIISFLIHYSLLSQTTSETLRQEALISFNSGKYGEAIKLMNRYISANPQDASGFNLRGSCYEIQGQYEKALYYFERSINRNPNFIPSYIYKMFVLELLGKNEEAEAAKNQLMQIYPDHRFSASYLFYIDERSNKNLDRPD